MSPLTPVHHQRMNSIYLMMISIPPRENAPRPHIPKDNEICSWEQPLLYTKQFQFSKYSVLSCAPILFSSQILSQALKCSYELSCLHKLSGTRVYTGQHRESSSGNKSPHSSHEMQSKFHVYTYSRVNRRGRGVHPYTRFQWSKWMSQDSGFMKPPASMSFDGTYLTDDTAAHHRI